MNFHTYSIAKTASKKIRALFNSTKFLSPEVALGHAWNIIIMSGMVLLLAT